MISHPAVIMIANTKTITIQIYYQVYPDDFGEFVVRVTNRYGTAQMAGFVTTVISTDHSDFQMGRRVPTW